jgi:hypothetical protein
MSEKIELRRIVEPDTEEVKYGAENFIIRNFMIYCLNKVLRGHVEVIGKIRSANMMGRDSRKTCTER